MEVIAFGARALDEAVVHIPLADILNLGSKLLHLVGHTVAFQQHERDAPEVPPGWLPQTNSALWCVMR